MKKLISAIITCTLALSYVSAYADADNSETVINTVSGYASAKSGDIELVSQAKTPSIYVDENDYAGVIRAADDLKDDIKTVTGIMSNAADNAESADIIIGTIGKSSVIDTLIAEDKLDVSEI